MEIKLSPASEEYLTDRVKSRDYASIDAAVDAIVQQVRDSEHQLTDEDLQAIEEAEAELAAGKGIDFDVFVAEMRKKNSA